MINHRIKKRRRREGRRHLLLALVLMVWTVAIVARLVHLQVTSHEDYRRRAEAQRRQELEILPPRGEIVDRHGLILAHSVLGGTVTADPRQLRVEGHQASEVAAWLAPMLGEKNPARLRAELERDRNFVVLKRRLNPEDALAVRDAIEERRLNGVAVQDEPLRFYPNGMLAAHILGYVDAEERGVDGLELAHDQLLRGEGGLIRLERDGRGQAYDRREDPARAGARIETTLELALQHQVELALERAWRETRARSASAVVLDPQTGAILASAVFPSFDPNRRPRLHADARANEAELAVRRNRVITDLYEPGSVFKIVTYAAALEEGLIRPQEKINCLNGSIELYGRVIGDHVGGWLTASDALAKSSNVGAIQLALKVARTRGEQRLVDYMRRLGFGHLTGVDLPREENGIVRDASRWHRTSIGSIAIGQEVGVTVLQLAAAMGAIGNGGLWARPHIVRRVTANDGRPLYEAQPETRRAISAKTAAELTGMLEKVVTGGTARRAVQLTGYTAAGKTGTPQKVDPVTRRYSQTKFMPTFAGFVPARDPRFAIVVMLDEPIGLHQGGQVSAPVFNLIAEAALQSHGVAPDAPEFRVALERMVEELQHQRLGSEAGPEVTRPSDPSSPADSPAPSAPVSPKEERVASEAPVFVSAALDPSLIETGQLPDFRGRRLQEVIAFCERLGVRPTLIGHGRVVRQFPAPGVRVRPGDPCRIEFE